MVTDDEESFYFNADEGEYRITIECGNGTQLIEVLITRTSLLIDYQDGNGLEFVAIPYSNLRSMIDMMKGS
jgi:hypothetical protein